MTVEDHRDITFWDASGLMGLAANAGASRNAPVVLRLLQLFPTPKRGGVFPHSPGRSLHSRGPHHMRCCTNQSPPRWASPWALLTPRREAGFGRGSTPFFGDATRHSAAFLPRPPNTGTGTGAGAGAGIGINRMCWFIHHLRRGVAVPIHTTSSSALALALALVCMYSFLAGVRWNRFTRFGHVRSPPQPAYVVWQATHLCNKSVERLP